MKKKAVRSSAMSALAVASLTIIPALVQVAYAAPALHAKPTPLSSSSLAAMCKPAALQSALQGISPKVAVGEIENGPKLPGGTRFTAANSNIPAYCQVTGTFVTNPKTGKTANFLATLPAPWNGKYLQLGCAGNCGSIDYFNVPADPRIVITNRGYPYEAIIKGYASFATDEGHSGHSWGAWAIKGPGRVDTDAIKDFYYRADLMLAQMGKQFTVDFYSHAKMHPQRISRSYFIGCSGGGRDAFVAASYFPRQFDGIVGGAPYANLMGVAFQWGGLAVAQLRSKDAQVPEPLIDKLDEIVKAKCDRLDGVKDGLLQNPMACDFEPKRDLPRCQSSTGGPQCFTSAQIDTISALLTAVTDEDGHLVQPGYTVSDITSAFQMATRPADLATRDPWPGIDGQSPLGNFWALAEGNLHVLVHENDPAFHTRDLFSFRAGGPGGITDFHIVVPKAEVSRAMSAARMGIGTIPGNAAELIKSNRKFIIYSNLSDRLLTPNMPINYYKQLAGMYGGYGRLQKHVRLFALPGTQHCGMAGPGPTNFDALATLENWVEKGHAPDALVANDPIGSNPLAPVPHEKHINDRTMLLCKFPEMAHYRGHGDVNQASSWTCPAHDRSMLKVGESGRQEGAIQ